jgi:quinoprotein relay system zinc metallohydrolase 1
MMRVRFLARMAFALGGLAAWAVQAQDLRALDYQLKARPLAPSVFVVEGANADFSPANGCNIINTGFIVTTEGVLVVNTGPSRRYGEQLRAAIAKVTPLPVVRVLHLNLHPDYFLGNQAFASAKRYATPRTREGIAREAKSYEDNMFRLCGDWMKGTETTPPDADIQPGPLVLGGRRMELREYRGHTDSDLVLMDLESGVVFAGGLVFVDRVPTTPHARVPDWTASLQQLEVDMGQLLAGKPLTALVPSHGPVRADAAGISQTLEYLGWLEQSLARSAKNGLEINEVLRAPVPEQFRRWAAFDTEFTRNVVHLYPRYEAGTFETLRPPKR